MNDQLSEKPFYKKPLKERLERAERLLRLPELEKHTVVQELVNACDLLEAHGYQLFHPNSENDIERLIAQLGIVTRDIEQKHPALLLVSQKIALLRRLAYVLS